MEKVTPVLCLCLVPVRGSGSRDRAERKANTTAISKNSLKITIKSRTYQAGSRTCARCHCSMYSSDSTSTSTSFEKNLGCTSCTWHLRWVVRGRHRRVAVVACRWHRSTTCLIENLFFEMKGRIRLGNDWMSFRKETQFFQM